MQRRSLMLASAGVLLGARAARAQSGVPGWPNKPVRIVVGFAPGGPTDVYARLVSDRLAQMLGQPVIVENRPGGGGVVANELVARADDQHTFLSTSISITAGFALRRGQVNYNVLRDFLPVTKFADVPNGIFVHPSMPVRTLPELVALAKQRPGQITMASPGNGTSGHVSQEYFKIKTGTDFIHVPYRGGGQVLADIVGGQVNSVMDNIPTYFEAWRDGRLRLLAVTTAQRLAALPDIPTVAETVLPGFDVSAWFGMLAPASTPAPVVEAMNRCVTAILREEPVAKRIRDGIAEPAPLTRADFAAFLKEDLERWEEVVRVSGAKAE